MKVTQIKDILTTVVNETLGKSDLVKEDLSNLVDIGDEIIDAQKVDNYVKKLVDRIGKVAFDSKIYQGSAPSVFMDSWEFGSVVQKISADMPNVSENDSWNLQDGQEYNQDTFYSPKVSAKFFNSRVTFDIKLSFTTQQIKDSFTSVSDLNAFYSMIQNSVQNALTLHMDNLIMRTINNFTANVLNEGQALQKVNLLTDYNTKTGRTLKAANALQDKEFLRYASLVIKSYGDRLTRMSELFNIGKRDKFTNSQDLHTILLSDFSNSATTYLQSDLQNPSMLALPQHEKVAYWQGSGQTFAFDKVSAINVTVKNGSSTKDVSQAGIIGVMFDTNALGVTNSNSRVTTAYNARAEFYTNFYKLDASYFNDLNENYVVFYIEDAK